MPSNAEPLAAGKEGLFSGKQIVLPLWFSLLITVAGYLTFQYFYSTADHTDFPARYLNNGYCLLIISVFVMASLYAVLQYLGLIVESYHIHHLTRQAAANPPLYRLGSLLSGRLLHHEDGFFNALQRWYEQSHSSEDFAKLSDYLLLLRGQQLQHNLGPLNFAVWVMPLLGFIGTVIGISQSIDGLEGVVAVTGSASREALQQVLSACALPLTPPLSVWHWSSPPCSMGCYCGSGRRNWIWPTTKCCSIAHFMARRYPADSAAGQALNLLPFLDIIFSMIGIFIVVFALQEVMEKTEGHQSAIDHLVICTNDELMQLYPAEHAQPIDFTATQIPALLETLGQQAGIRNLVFAFTRSCFNTQNRFQREFFRFTARLREARNKAVFRLTFRPLSEQPGAVETMLSTWRGRDESD
ncbi:MAG: MotA/TolQ/ExbB proton channel family protein [Candidatus Competibacteraceae bacterium]